MRTFLFTCMFISKFSGICTSFSFKPRRSIRSTIIQHGIQMSSTQSNTKFIFVGGKGGVGKTSSSSAVAIKLADQGFRTLVVSTDPAHSLGDALDTNLKSGIVTPIITDPNLWALEIDVDSALNEFKNLAKDLDSDSLATSLGVPKTLLDSFGIDDLAQIFTNPPPGIDEVVALLRVFEYADQTLPQSTNPRFNRIVIDTAPTGHTIRLLQLPSFLNSLTGRLIKVKSKLQGAIDSFKSFLNPDSASNVATAPTLSIFDKLEMVQQRLQKMKVTLKNPNLTQFVVVSIPTQLSVAESNRLIDNLRQEDISISAVICNQIVTDESNRNYMRNRQRSQQSSLQDLQSSKPGNVLITEIPYFDTEVTGIYGLRFFASIAHRFSANNPVTNPLNSKRLTIFGGKGGVGKTTSSASWGVQLADAGMKVLVVSTDPAHSLGDALSERLTGTPRLLDSTSGGGQLWAMEIDPVEAIGEFQELMRDALGSGATEGGGAAGNRGMMGGMGLPDLKGELLDLVSGVKEPPAGTDEVVALTKVVSILENGYVTPSGMKVRFDRVVLDTAPTGHTLRMLTLPKFFIEFVKKLRSVRDKLGNMGGILGGFGSQDDAINSSGSREKLDRLLNFEDRMRRLDEIIHSHKDCEFTVVTIPTQVAVAETKRLVNALQEDNIQLRRVLVNQVIRDPGSQDASDEDRSSAADAYLNRVRSGQKKSLNELETIANRISVPLVKVPYFEMETRTVYGLRAIANSIFSDEKVKIGS